MIEAAFKEIAKKAMETTSKELPNFANNLKESSVKSFSEADKPFKQKFAPESKFQAKNFDLNNLDDIEKNCWEPIGKLSEKGHMQIPRDNVGVYRAVKNGETVYIGRAIEFKNGGFRKRLSDYTRNSDSARTHPSGQKMFNNSKDIEIEIIRTGNDEKAVEKAKILEQKLIEKHNPEWNDKFNHPTENFNEITSEENNIYKNENLKDTEINGRECKINDNFDINEKVGLNGETNLELMDKGKSPIDNKGEKIELHHIGQDPNGGFAELPTTAHRGSENFKVLHKNFDESKIDRNRFNTEKANHWKERARIIKEGV